MKRRVTLRLDDDLRDYVYYMVARTDMSFNAVIENFLNLSRVHLSSDYLASVEYRRLVREGRRIVKGNTRRSGNHA